MTETCLPIVQWLKNWFTSTDDLLDKTYPIGSIYMSVNNTSPATLFGGTWVQIEDTFLLASGTNHSNGATGGEETHTLTENEMPSHTHTQNAHSHSPKTGRQFLTAPTSSGWTELKGSNVSGSGYWYLASNSSDCNVYTQASGSATATNQNKGGGQAHNNMPPYLTVNMWKRTA